MQNVLILFPVKIFCVVFGCLSHLMVAGPLPGIYQMDELLPILKNKKIAVVANHTSIINATHLVDTLLKQRVDIVKIFSPEHGFRGTASAGEKVSHTIDPATNKPIISLYGANKKPTTEQLKDVEVVVFDLQDVGVRFFTYISTLHYVMEACAENKKLLVVLDRPNPNGMYIEGPILDTALRSFVGMHPIPVLHGLTIGELAAMINGEKWLPNSLCCPLKVIKCIQYTHADEYELPVKPSPNLPNAIAIKLYASLCLFEGTPVSVGRGTYFPFQVAGWPNSTAGTFTFTPVSIQDMAKEPPYKNIQCFGLDLRDSGFTGGLTLRYLFHFYHLSAQKNEFFTPFFHKLIGTTQVVAQIKQGKTEVEIKNTWQPDIEKYKRMRKKYLIYP